MQYRSKVSQSFMDPSNEDEIKSFLAKSSEICEMGKVCRVLGVERVTGEDVGLL